MKWTNELTDLLKISYPIIQAPMLGVTSVEMVAAISNQGGLGSLPVGGLSPEKTAELIAQTKKLTNKPFAVNLFVHDIPLWEKGDIEEMQKHLEAFCKINKLSCSKIPVEAIRFHSYTEQIELLLKEKIPVVSFTFGVLKKDIIKTFKEQGVALIGTATCLKEARILEQLGIDSITAQGIEAGGHRGTFLADEPLPLIGSMSLIPQLAANIKCPVIAAGGINDGKTIRAAMILGAKGVQVGTGFIASDESLAIPSYKTALKNAVETDSVLTKAFSGRWARGLRNRFIEHFENSDIKIPVYPLQGSLTLSMRTAARQQDNKELTTMWAGQSSSKSEDKPAAEIFKFLIEDTAFSG